MYLNIFKQCYSLQDPFCLLDETDWAHTGIHVEKGNSTLSFQMLPPLPCDTTEWTVHWGTFLCGDNPLWGK